MARHAPIPKPLVDEESQLEKNTRSPVSFSFNLKWLPVNFHPQAWLGIPAQLFSKLWKKAPSSPVKDIRILAGAAAVLLVLIGLIVSVSNCAHRHAAEKHELPAPQAKTTRMLLDKPLPDLYLVEPGKIESSR